jgi:hypothetical protein
MPSIFDNIPSSDPDDPVESWSDPTPAQRAREATTSSEALGMQNRLGTGTFLEPEPPTVLGRRVRDIQDWSPRSKARLETFAKEKCEVYGVPFRHRVDIIEMSQVRAIMLFHLTRHTN